LRPLRLLCPLSGRITSSQIVETVGLRLRPWMLLLLVRMLRSQPSGWTANGLINAVDRSVWSSRSFGTRGGPSVTGSCCSGIASASFGNKTVSRSDCGA